MYQNCIAFQSLASELNTVLLNTEFVDCYSTGKEELYLVFEKGEKDYFFIRLNFPAGKLYISFPENAPNVSRKHLRWFQEAYENKVTSISSHGNDRSFRISLSNEFTLVFKAYGSASNLICFEGDKWNSHFRISHTVDENLNLSEFDFTPAISVDGTSTDLESFKGNNRHIPDHLAIELLQKHKGFSKGSFESEVEKSLELAPRIWYVNPGVPQYKLSTEEADSAFQSSSIIEAYNELFFKVIPSFHLNQRKQQLLKQVRSELKRSRQQVKKLGPELEKLKNRRSYKELADIIMANLYNIDSGVKEVELDDFYKGGKVKVKLNEDLSPQANAEKYYRKSKSEGKEWDLLKQRIEKLESLQLEQEDKLNHIESVSTIKELKPFENSIVPKQEVTRLPFRELFIGDEKVWIGKNANSNDELLRYSSKNDLWFHAKDITGSHVIVSRPSAKAKSEKFLEDVASLAAHFSKAKNQTVVPVSFTLRKYVRKPKGFPPGKVLVSQSDTLLVKPKSPEELDKK